MGIGGTDILGRLNWHALASLGDGAGPRGGSLGVAYRGWRWAPSLQVFSALERPSSQRFMPVHGMDRERRGAELALIFENRGTLPFTLGPFVSYERIVSMEAERETVSRSFSGAFTSIRKRWSRGEDWSLAAQMKLRGGFGRTDDHSWSLARAEIGLAIANPVLPITLRAESGRVGGDPTSLDHLHLGGVTSSIVPAGLDGNRVEQPALPAFRATGNRLTRWRGEVLLFPEAGIRGYIEHTALWDSHRSRSPYLKVTGLEWPIHERVPDALASSLLGRFTLTLGLHRILNETRPDRPMKDRTVFTLSLILRP
jgi:hypothetical protein